MAKMTSPSDMMNSVSDSMKERTGKTLEECGENLKGVIEGWIALRLRLGLAIPPINGQGI